MIQNSCQQNAKLCVNKNGHSFLENKSIEDLTSMGDLRLVHQIAQDTNRDIVKCWWNGGEIKKCKEQFGSSIHDLGVCFTYFPNRRIAKDIQTSGKKCAI